MLFKQVREMFIFTSKERNGLLILLFILFVTICLDFALPLLLPEKTCDVSAWKEEAEKYYATIPLKVEPEAEIFKGVFDPNVVVDKVLIEIGIPPGIAANWVKYLQKGGHFKKKEEIMKLYGMTSDLYRKVEGYLVIPDQVGDFQSKTVYSKQRTKGTSGFAHKDSLWNSHYKERKMIQLLEINKADSAQLEALPGIGPVLASRIVKYRRLLGGFQEIAQLKEIYGMTEELWIRSSCRLFADPSEMKKLDINFLTVADLGRHPYIGFRQAKKIVKKRDTSGKFTRKEEMIAFFSPDSLQRLLPYLSISGIEP